MPQLNACRSRKGMDYTTLIRELNALRRGPRPETHATGQKCVRGKPATAGMDRWINLLGYSLADVNALKVIHVAGTKGKGSTCAFTECILRQHGLKTGLYISPHLNNVRERIRINSQPLNENKFTEYASFVFESLGLRKQPNDAPRYLQFLTLVSFVAFIKERVDVAIYETHQGGEFDSTNIITEPMVTAITSLGRDHMHQLGPTLEDVAWHKAGIFKGGAAAFSVPQEPTLASVLEARAEKKGVNLQFVDVGDNIPKDVIMPEPRVQQLNFSLAWAICNAFIKKTGTNLLSPNNLKIALKSYSWPGRFQQISDGDVTWFLDGAHNEISLGVCAEWFASASAKLEPGSSIDRVLIFSHYSTHRDGLELLTALVNSLSNHTIYIRQALFTRCEYANNDPQTRLLEDYTKIWNENYRKSDEVRTSGTAFDAFQSVRQASRKRHVLVTGSLHLVGLALDYLAQKQN